MISLLSSSFKHLAIEKAYIVIYHTGGTNLQVQDMDVLKWFYFACSPNIIVKAEATRKSKFGQHKATGDVKDALPLAKDSLKYYEQMINSRILLKP
ncbi:MAG: hypothetical protein Q7R56_03280 [Nanoarchaeota archaeon]|nr:hypothetical protein [Nanoarchaeota archaeon]